MTKKDIARIEGELFGLKVLLMNLVSFQAGQTTNPLGHIAALRDQSVAGIVGATNSAAGQYQQYFRECAAGFVVEVAEVASVVFDQSAPRPKLQ